MVRKIALYCVCALAVAAWAAGPAAEVWARGGGGGGRSSGGSGARSSGGGGGRSFSGGGSRSFSGSGRSASGGGSARSFSGSSRSGGSQSYSGSGNSRSFSAPSKSSGSRSYRGNSRSDASRSFSGGPRSFTPPSNGNSARSLSGGSRSFSSPSRSGGGQSFSGRSFDSAGPSRTYSRSYSGGTPNSGERLSFGPSRSGNGTRSAIAAPRGNTASNFARRGSSVPTNGYRALSSQSGTPDGRRFDGSSSAMRSGNSTASSFRSGNFARTGPDSGRASDFPRRGSSEQFKGGRDAYAAGRSGDYAKRDGKFGDGQYSKHGGDSKHGGYSKHDGHHGGYSHHKHGSNVYVYGWGWPLYWGSYLWPYRGYGVYGGYYADDYPAYGSVAYYNNTIVEQGEPIQQAAAEELPAEQAPAAPPVSRQGLEYLREAEDAFRQGDYAEAQRLTNHALVEMPGDGVSLLFMSQVLFALEDFRSSAAALQQGMSLVAPEDWGYIVKNYASFYRGDAYVRQMDKLVTYAKENPQAAYARFLKGYHYGYLGHLEAARKNLQEAITLEPRDEMAQRLLVQFGGQPPVAKPAEASSSAADKVPASPPPGTGAPRLPAE